VPQNVNFAIRATGLAAFLQSNGINLDATSKAAKMSPPDLARRVNVQSRFTTPTDDERTARSATACADFTQPAASVRLSG
jgi:hypothetical protein